MSKRMAFLVGLLGLLSLGACPGGAGDNCGDERCDARTQYCHEHIVDGPSEFTCEPFPQACEDTRDCECLQADIDLCDSVQSCEMDGDLALLECVEG